MSYEFSDPQRQDDPTALPDVEVFHVQFDYTMGVQIAEPESEYLTTGFYWWACFPGCLPDGDPIGPFDTYDEALQDARSVNV